MTSSIVFDPLVPWPLLVMVAVIAAIGVMLALVRGLRGWPLRGLAGLFVLAALAGPSFQQEDRAPLSDIVLMLEDQSASQRLGDRAAPRRRRNPGAFPERRRFRLRASRSSSSRASLTSDLSRHPCHLEIRLRLPPPQARVDFPTASACPAAPPAAPCLPA